MKKVLLSCLLIAAMIFTFVGCGNAANKVTVTYYDSDATTVLKTVETTIGATAEEYTPTKEGYEFTGWFGTPQMTHAYDFAKTLDADTSLFAGFVSVVADTREFSIVGSGSSPVLIDSNWGKNISDKHKLSKTEGKNEYTITLDLYEGDEFQFAIDTEWNNQRGYGYLTTIEQDGKEYFANSGGIGDVLVKKSNIKCAVTGNYTLTLVTYPGEDYYDTENTEYKEESKEKFNMNNYDQLTFTYNGEAKEAKPESTTNYYLKGKDITGWADKYTASVAMTVKDGIHTLTIPLAKDDEFLFTSMVTVGKTQSVGTEYLRYTNLDDASKAVLDSADSANMIVKENGLYTFSYDPATTVMTVTVDNTVFLPEYDYYMKGSYGGTNWGTEGNPDYQLVLTDTPFTYVLPALTVKVGDEMGMESMEGANRILFYNFSNLSTAADTNANADFEEKSGGNILAKADGTYTVTFNAYTNELTFTKAE